jgi:solute carrier family 25, member 39/40
MSGDSCCAECPCLEDDTWQCSFRGAYTNTHEVLRQIFGSVLGSTATVLVLNPLNVVKVRLQHQSLNSGRQQSIRAMLRETAQSGRAMRTLWSGTSSGLLLAVPNTTTYMVSYEQCKSIFADLLPSTLLQFSPAFSGAVARALAVTVVSPLELARTLQTSGVQRSVASIAAEVVSTHGLRGLFRGWTSTILRDCPFSALYWLSVENVRPLIHSHIVNLRMPAHTNSGSKSNSDSPTSSNTNSNSGSNSGSDNSERDKYHPMASFVAGASSGLLAALATHPFDVLKTHRQLTALHTPVVAGTQPTTESPQQTQTLQTLFTTRGLRGLYSGLSLRLFTVIPASAIMITIYEYWR